ncbi:MAG: hypothetical protein RBJ76_13375 [Stenomitos frigidus ULC029]
MTALTFKQRYAFEPSTLSKVVAARMGQRFHGIEVQNMTGSFRLLPFCTTENFTFSLGIGAKEPAHVDLPTYQAILILEPNGWVLKSPRVSHQVTYQDAGDLIVLDAGLQHEVIWDRHHPKPTSPWLYLFIDPYKRQRWAKVNISQHQAAAMALEAVAELSDPNFQQWLLS